MPATMATASLPDRTAFQGIRLLTQTRQSVVLSHISDNWHPVSPLGHKGRWHICHPKGNGEALLLQELGQAMRRPFLFKDGLGIVPDVQRRINILLPLFFNH